ncbi:MAG: GDSL-type esterase/lipase family protein [Clostridia bacterium]|nr:GDSL-type esterase/lipase family protein [Clostridia bacterium]
MKKYLAFCLSALLILSLTTGCGSPAEETESSVPESSQSEVSRTESSVESSEESSEEESQESSESSVESTPDPDPSSESSTVPAGSDVGASFFDDAVFIGDSISLRLTMYCQANPDALGKAQFLTAGSLGSGNALWDENSQDAVFPTYNGQVVTLQDGVQKSGAKKVFIMLGMNDVGLYGVEGARDNMETLIGLILEKSPNVTIYVQSMTPMLTTHQLKSLNNPNIEAYNKLLREMCAEHGWNFVDVASVMKESDGGLIPAYCSDGGDGGMGMHFTNEGAVAWVNYLRTHVS